jgi:hypothetical protein
VTTRHFSLNWERMDKEHGGERNDDVQ